MTLPETMNCIEISKPGGPEVLKPTIRPVPTPTAFEVSVAGSLVTRMLCNKCVRKIKHDVERHDRIVSMRTAATRKNQRELLLVSTAIGTTTDRNAATVK